MNILLGITGSVAATLTGKLQLAIEEAGHELKTVATESSIKFGRNQHWKYFHSDEDEWTYYRERKAVLHIDLVKWADVLVVAPCTANTLSKLSVGICDNLLTSCVRAWDHNKRMIVAPAMNTQMYNNQPTLHHLGILEGRGVEIVDPISKKLFCGDEGIGAMAHIEDILKQING